MDFVLPISSSNTPTILSINSAPVPNAPIIQPSVPASQPPAPAPTITSAFTIPSYTPIITTQISTLSIPPPIASTIDTLKTGFSFLTTSIYHTQNIPIYQPVNASSINGGFNSNVLNVSTINCSEISTGLLSLDQAIITADGGDLLLNGIPIATTANLSSIADWSIYPAVSTIHMDMNNMLNAKTITAQDFIGNLLNINQAFISDLTVYQQTTENFASTITIDGRTINCSTINVQDNLFSEFATVSTLTVSSININGSNINPNNNDWSLFPAQSKVNMAGYDLYSGNGNNMTVNADNNLNLYANTSNVNIFAGASNLVALGVVNVDGRQINMNADGNIDIGSYTDININASNGNRGRINLTAEPGFNNGVGGEIHLLANGGSFSNVGSGGLITLDATTANPGLTSAIKMSASGVNSYAGAIPSVGSLAGYNFIYGTAGVNVCAGLPSVFPNVPGTTYIYGTNGVSIDGLNTCQIKNTLGFEVPNTSYLYGIQPFFNGLTTPPDMTIRGRTVNLVDNVSVVLSNVKHMYMESFADIQNVKTINMSNTGSNTISNVNNIIGSGGVMSGFNSITGQQINFASAVGTNASVNGVLQCPSINMLGSGAITGLTSINGQPYPPGGGGSNAIVSTFNIASISSATISSINNFASFGTKSMRIQGDVAQIQLSNNNVGGVGNILNLLSRVNQSEIQSFNSNFTTPQNLVALGNNFGWNTSNFTYLTNNFTVNADVEIQGNNGLTVSTITGVNSITNAYGGDGILLSNVSSIFGYNPNTTGGAYQRIFEYFYNPPTGVGAGGAEICMKGKAQNAGAVASMSLGTDVQAGQGYIQSVWDGNISMPMSFYGANFNFQSDSDYILFLDGQQGQPATLSTGFTFYQASTITQKNQHLTAGIRQPFIQYGNITTTGSSGSQQITLPIAYETVRFNAQVSMNDTNPAQMSVVNVDSNIIEVYWANGGGGTHSINWTTFGDI